MSTLKKRTYTEFSTKQNFKCDCKRAVVFDKCMRRIDPILRATYERRREIVDKHSPNRRVSQADSTNKTRSRIVTKTNKGERCSNSREGTMELVPLVVPIQPTDSRAVDIELDSMAAKVQVSSTEDHTYILPCTNNSLVRDCHRLMTVSDTNGVCKCKAHGRNDTPLAGVVCIDTTEASIWDAEKSQVGEPKNGNEAYRGKYGSELCLVEHLWEITSSEQLNTFSDNRLSGGIVNSSSKPGTEIGVVSRNTINRAHIREFIHYESEAIGIATPGSDLPAYQWDLENDPPSLTIGKVALSSKHQPLIDEHQSRASETCFIPTNIRGSPRLVERITAICTKHKLMFNTKLGKNPALIPPMELEVDETLWCINANKGPPRNQTLEKQSEVQKQVLAMLKNEVISISQAEYYSQVHLTPKPTSSHSDAISPDVTQNEGSINKTTVQSNFSAAVKTGWRFCIDFRGLNACCKGLGWPIPNIRHMLQRLGNKRPKIFGKVDLTAGYHQAPLGKDSRRFSAFMTHMGCFEWNRVAMGLKGAGPWFQGVLAALVLLGLLYFICELYIDDLLIYGDNEDEFCKNLDTVFTRLVKYNITVNPDKCELGVNELEFVGHVMNEKGLTHTREKIEKVLQIPAPERGKDLKSFLGVAVYLCDHIMNYAIIVHPLHLMLKNYSRERRLVWTQEGLDAFEAIKTAINNCSLLYFIDDISPITLYTDASDFGIGGFLSQTIDGPSRTRAIRAAILYMRAIHRRFANIR